MSLNEKEDLLNDVRLTCMDSAKFGLRFSEEILGKNFDVNRKHQYTVVDFWTTACTRCPEALDHLNGMAATHEYENTFFISICCGSLEEGIGAGCDPAREIRDRAGGLNPRWNDMDGHYHTDVEGKEILKKVFGFRTVPFYAVFSKDGDVLQTGGPKSIDWDALRIEPNAVSKKNVTTERQLNNDVSPASNNVFMIDEDF
uniref:Thioredoxin domain-containing protein n=1 Tax=Corethron hystrix TaxID=216773 RepID=A0A6U5LBN3_9STRA|mmetsp:Transcript_4739/g.9331  ORF Transcript_4739/g.9331 Transcript_4739/m.9331 type:complete len:200 (+) Transcript_4739:264-863(+)|eukprot:CAMPEP_0113299526 /NCGR_PEP_ID=MMETSP0010_2-20120614/1528_1 /TAXON_ID=216773 ORGANISM="Corethron hystrix, Strain 308" /NCGR_SAMPLE_ID=MMETSP0010_2 /ASSEMBLY_ACC=CAM_ASM_000155 /LENGTH=199 /DNA_ID=CAMNT_0000152783 /DNA_START=168 /DNA_END=770 /DNA_ORIENTATION=+ /assembly_acc=CAM_ASM_000155